MICYFANFDLFTPKKPGWRWTSVGSALAAVHRTEDGGMTYTRR